MRVLLVLAAVVVAASAASLHFGMGSSEHDAAWASFKQRFSKRYPSPAHEAVRRVVWERNLRYIQKHNLEADLGKHTFRLGVNEYADLSNDEYRQQLLCRGLNTSRSAGALFLPPSNLALPSSVDWRSQGYVTAVKNQGQCGSCWAFSATGSLEGQHFRKTKKLVSLSEQQLVDCSKSFGNNGCGGGLMDNAFRYIKANGGIDSEASYPYEAIDDRCRFKRADVAATVTGYTDIEKFNETQLQVATATVGPISVAIDAGHLSFQLYHEGVYNEPQCSQTTLDHGVLVVGYGIHEGLDYWLVKNSWSPKWGQNGYIMMSRNKNNQCGIATQASYPLV